MERLNLSLCEGINIEISYPFILKDDIEKYNSKSFYYNDICSKATSESGTDIILKDRRKEFINNNMSLCENNCDFIEYDGLNQKTKCSCKVKTFLDLDFKELDKEILMKSFLDIKKIANLDIMKCYKNVFNKNNLFKNYGSIIIFLIFILFFVTLILFYCKYWKKLLKEINDIIEAKKNKNNYKNNNNLIENGNHKNI